MVIELTLSEKERLEAREWRIKKCGSASFRVLFDLFNKEMDKLKIGETLRRINYGKNI